jgi:hypothetical protein
VFKRDGRLLSRGIGLLVSVSKEIELRANVGAMQRLLPPLTFTPSQFDIILVHSGYPINDIITIKQKEAERTNTPQTDNEKLSLLYAPTRLTHCAQCGDVTDNETFTQCQQCCRVIHPTCIPANNPSLGVVTKDDLWTCNLCVNKTSTQPIQ